MPINPDPKDIYVDDLQRRLEDAQAEVDDYAERLRLAGAALDEAGAREAPLDERVIWLAQECERWKARAAGAEAEVNRLALLLCPPMPKGWREAEPWGAELAAVEQINGELRSSIDRTGSLLTQWCHPPGEARMTIATQRPVAAYLLGVLHRQEGAVS